MKDFKERLSFKVYDIVKEQPLCRFSLYVYLFIIGWIRLTKLVNVLKCLVGCMMYDEQDEENEKWTKCLANSVSLIFIQTSSDNKCVVMNMKYQKVGTLKNIPIATSPFILISLSFLQ